jgi:hypothetical protein
MLAQVGHPEVGRLSLEFLTADATDVMTSRNVVVIAQHAVFFSTGDAALWPRGFERGQCALRRGCTQIALSSIEPEFCSSASAVEFATMESTELIRL